MTAGMIRLPPEAPIAKPAPSSPSAIVGHMLLALMRLPGAIVVGRPGRGSK